MSWFRRTGKPQPIDCKPILEQMAEQPAQEAMVKIASVPGSEQKPFLISVQEIRIPLKDLAQKNARLIKEKLDEILSKTESWKPLWRSDMPAHQADDRNAEPLKLPVRAIRHLFGFAIEKKRADALGKEETYLVLRLPEETETTPKLDIKTVFSQMLQGQATMLAGGLNHGSR